MQSDRTTAKGGHFAGDVFIDLITVAIDYRLEFD
jgi:hypothetical protein